jgi:protein-export membrane protein SecD
MNIMNVRKKTRITIVFIILLAVVVGLISYPKAVQRVPKLYDFFNKKKISLGLDLQGGIHLEYKADVSKIDSSKVNDSLQAVQDVIERRINAFGVGEPLVQVAKSGNDYNLIIELPGIKNIEDAKNKIQETPSLEFKEEGMDSQFQQLFDSQNKQAVENAQKILEQVKNGSNFEDLAKEKSQDPTSKDKGGDLGFIKKPSLYGQEFDDVVFGGKLKPNEINPTLVETQNGWEIIKFIESRGEGDNLEVHVEHIFIANAKLAFSQYPEFSYKSTGLTGENLKSATAQYQNGQGLGQPEVALQFDSVGTKLFADLTKRNLGKRIAIFIDGEIKSAPTVQSEISDGTAVITGSATIDEAKDLARKLNEGALPVPLSLIGQQSIEATLGADSLKSILSAGAIGLAVVIIFMLIFYRFLGLVASLALLIYTGIMISIFKLVGITLTLSGIAGFVLSIGMAVDANILIFERTKEEIRKGKTIANSLIEGFKRAWTSIRDGNISSLLTAGILYWMGTGFVKGFAAALFIGVLVSMFTAVVITRTLLKAIIGDWIHGRVWMVGVKKSDIAD